MTLWLVWYVILVLGAKQGSMCKPKIGKKIKYKMLKISVGWVDSIRFSWILNIDFCIDGPTLYDLVNLYAVAK